MICSFCHHEFDDNLTECPYCHRVVEKEAKSLTVEERESFGGDTIELDGTVYEGSRQSGDDSAREGEYQETYGEGPYERADGKNQKTGSGTDDGFKVHQFHAGGILFWAVLLILVVCIVFFLLPAFFLFALVAAAAFFLYRLFAGFFA